MKNKLLALLFILMPLFSALAQIEQPVSWQFSHTKVEDGKYKLTFKANIESGWHLYSVSLPEGGPIATSINYESSDIIMSKEDLVESPAPEKHYDSAFDMELAYWSNQATISQIVEVTSGAESISGYVEFMVCDDERCLPPDQVDFSFDIKEKIAVQDTKPSATSEDTNSYWSIFFIALGAGLIALLTPCVFPMMPMTVSFFTKQSSTKAKGIKNAMFYGFFIVAIYVLIGSIIGLIPNLNPDDINEFSTGPAFNIFLFIILVVFAISFLGAFELTMPSSWVNKADRGVDKGGVIGAFFMALTLALVSFSCTGPIVGGILVKAVTEGGIAPIIGMAGFGVGLALPFVFFAMFPGFMNSLPKSGGWLNSVKVVLGFVELAFAFKFLSNADLVLGLHLLEREVYIAIWIAIFGALGFYLLGKIRLPHDSPMEYLPVSRLLMGLFVLSFTIYMIPGLWGAPLKLISAFPPPMEYAESPEGVGNRARQPIRISATDSENKELVKLEEKMEVGPQGLSVFHDYDDALAYAKEVGKPLFIDFTGKACVNCRQMEINVWSDPAVNSLMKNDYVVVALYVDYRKQLPKEEQYISETTGKKIRTVGNKWSDFQISRYKINSQPYYVLLDHNEKELAEPKAYEPNKNAYAEWLKEGLENFEK
ncbi:DUF255 domain-containing protein [Labilibacter sediminis]|nr:DUF255 domain-containing protein [Labilibacter sediminis]